MTERGMQTEREPGRALDGAAIEAPVTHPFEGFVFLRKEWVDQEEGIGEVCFNYVLSPLNQPADWAKVQSHVMMPQWGQQPLSRIWIVRLPTHLDGHDSYLFHYYFTMKSAQTGAEPRASETFTQLIAPREVECLDYSGQLTNARLHWSIGNWEYPQDTEMEVDGIGWGSEFSVSQVPYRGNDPLYLKGRLLSMRRLELPRRFRARIWGPRGSTVRFCFHLMRLGADDPLSRWDNNQGRDYSITL